MESNGLAETVAAPVAAAGRRIAFVGPERWLRACAIPPSVDAGATQVVVSERAADISPLTEAAPEVTVVFAPASLPPEVLRELPGLTLGVLTESSDEDLDPAVVDSLLAVDRVLTFRPALSGRPIGATGRVWRAIPPPVSDSWYVPLRPLSTPARAMTVGRATRHRERALLASKHQHDLLQVVHGIEGPALANLMREHPVAVYVPPGPRGFGTQIGMHLAAGQLVIAVDIGPLHGLEPGLDYLSVRDGVELVHRLGRVQFFPEMYRRIQLRGRLKAETFRASRVFARIADDLVGDVAVFGSPRRDVAA